MGAARVGASTMSSLVSFRHSATLDRPRLLTVRGDHERRQVIGNRRVVRRREHSVDRWRVGRGRDGPSVSIDSRDRGVDTTTYPPPDEVTATTARGRQHAPAMMAHTVRPKADERRAMREAGGVASEGGRRELDGLDGRCGAGDHSRERKTEREAHLDRARPRPTLDPFNPSTL